MESGRQPVQFCKALGGVAFGCDVLLLVVQVLLKVLLYVNRNRRLIRDGSPGRPPRLSHCSLALPSSIACLAYLY